MYCTYTLCKHVQYKCCANDGANVPQLLSGHKVHYRALVRNGKEHKNNCCQLNQHFF